MTEQKCFDLLISIHVMINHILDNTVHYTYIVYSCILLTIILSHISILFNTSKKNVVVFLLKKNMGFNLGPTKNSENQNCPTGLGMDADKIRCTTLSGPSPG